VLWRKAIYNEVNMKNASSPSPHPVAIFFVRRPGHTMEPDNVLEPLFVIPTTFFIKSIALELESLFKKNTKGSYVFISPGVSQNIKMILVRHGVADNSHFHTSYPSTFFPHHREDGKGDCIQIQICPCFQVAKD